jgi:lipoate-protein ligase A
VSDRLPFRLIIDRGWLRGSTNMARDEAILRAVSAGQQAPTLRLYGWQPPFISLGLSQRMSTVDVAACARDNVGIVRRPTGGLAILHTDELTYSMTLPIAHPIAAGDVMTSYRRIARAIIAALQSLGVSQAHADAVAKADKATSPVCFEAPSDYEVMSAPKSAGGKKLVGSAQWRRVDGVLQHGSLPLFGDIGRVCAYLIGAPPAAAVREHAATLSDVLGRAVTWDEVAQVFAKACADTLGIDFTHADLSPIEMTYEQELLAHKYGSDVWNKRR